MAKEKRFENKVKGYLTSLGAYHIKHFANAFTKRGVPDILCCLNGIFIGIEVKADDGHPSEIQKYNIHQINKSGGIGLILYPKGFDTFKALCEEVMKCNTHTRRLNAIRSVHTDTNCDMLTDYEP